MSNSNSTKWTNILIIGLKVFTKITSISAKVTKFALAGISLAAYTYMFSWPFALMIMAQLLIHEYGHIWAMKMTGIKTKGIYFIPFVGGAAVADEDFKTRKDEVFIAIMGPVFGFFCALLMYIIYFITLEPIFAAGASWMAMLNLFNLLPINPLDGGRIMKSIAFSVHSSIGIAFLALGILGAIFLAFYAHIWIFILVVILSSIELTLEIWLRKRLLKKENKQTEELKEELTAMQKRIDDLKKKHLDSNTEIPQNLNEMSESTKQNLLRLEELQNETKIKYNINKPNMTPKEITLAVLQYFALAIVLYIFMSETAHIPGAALAMEVLQ